MRRLTFFTKGNSDVHDSLHSCRIGGKLVWNGINDVLRGSHPGCVVRLKHETWTRSDAVLRSDGIVPKELGDRQLPLGSYPAETQFSRALFETKADAIILSIQPDVTTSLMRHRKEGFLLYTSEIEQWSADDRHWLRTEFERTGSLELAESMTNMAAIIEKVREQSEAPILIYNLSPIVPGEAIRCHQGVGEIYSTRVRKFNLGLIELSEKTGISIIDVDSLLARKGADALKLDPLHLTPEGHQLVAEEVVRVLEDVGVFDEEKS
jgi:hypothetical protein